MMNKFSFFLGFIFQTSFFIFSQQDTVLLNLDYRIPKEYEIAGITVSGENVSNPDLIITLSGLSIGQKVKLPSDIFSDAIRRIYKNGSFENVTISLTRVEGNFIYINIDIKDRPRLLAVGIRGLRKSEAKNIKEKINLKKGDILTTYAILNAQRIIENYFVKKGFYEADVRYYLSSDSVGGAYKTLTFEINKGKRVKIEKIHFIGASAIPESKLKRTMKDTKEKRIYGIFKTSKLIRSDFEKDKYLVLQKYREQGYRDASIIKDSLVRGEKGLIVYVFVDEGNRYYFGDITFSGNVKYSDEQLKNILEIKKGDPYNQKWLETRLYMNPNGKDISSLYMDDGYLFFSVSPIEKKIYNDTIDIELQIYEGKQAIINDVTIVGNTKTNDHVILRELKTKPGDLFSRADIIRSQRELMQLRYFNNEKIGVNPKPDPVNGTVDLEYTVEETSNDQLELSGGWGMGRIVGTFGLSFNNFSARKLLDFKSYRPLPSGDGQKVSVRAQSNGLYYQSYNFNFIDPWLGGRKPNMFSFTVYHSIQTNGISKKKDGTLSETGDTLKRQVIKITGISLGLGKRLKWPDDYFNIFYTLGYQHYYLDDFFEAYTFTKGRSNNINLNITLSRNSTFDPIFPKSGSDISISAAFTPPYSLMNKRDYSQMSDEEKFKWLEYHKWKLSMTFYSRLIQNLVLMFRVKYGFLGMYNANVGLSPFERFYLGGDGLSGFALDGREIIGMRGYGNQVLTPRDSKGRQVGATIFSKYTLEFRYPLSTNPMATIFVLAFMEGGDTWLRFKDFTPFQVKRSAGLGVRVYLPMFGLLGLDYGIGFDKIPGIQDPFKGQFHFSINSSID
ncbi:MAG: outer membrane protein assembly factor BamA [Bacteroidales bacterium]|nr:outer membrane protein assembly factor BamA [Bacteroidales bacterium]